MLKRFLPTPESLKNSRALRWLGPRIHDPALWRMEPGSAARGIALGAFFGLMIPVAQIPAAALAALLLRANVLLAAAATLISNPLTYGPLYYFAFRLGKALLGPLPGLVAEREAGWLTQIGVPLLTGMLTMALVTSVLAYTLTHLVWRLWRLLPRRRKPT